MRKLVLVLIAVAGLVAMSDSASAKDKHSKKVRNSQPQYQQNDRPSLFGGLIEMERRKNAWLRQTFFGQ